MTVLLSGVVCIGESTEAQFEANTPNSNNNSIMQPKKKKKKNIRIQLNPNERNV